MKRSNVIQINTVYRQKTPLELCSSKYPRSIHSFSCQAAWLFHSVSPRISEKPDEKKTAQKVIVGGRALPCLVRVHVFDRNETQLCS